MRLFKRTTLPDLPELEAVASRLHAVTRRGKVETSRYPSREEPVAAPAPQRLFQMPNETSVNDGDA